MLVNVVYLIRIKLSNRMKTKEIRLEVREYEAEEDIDQSDASLIEEAKTAAVQSYAPYSGFHVGAAVLLQDGIVVTGNNQENSAYPSGLCAERIALFYANAHYPNQSVKAIAIVAFDGEEQTAQPVRPCGSCAQVLLETEVRYHRPIRVIMSGKNKTEIIDSVRVLLPLGFDPGFL